MDSPLNQIANPAPAPASISTWDQEGLRRHLQGMLMSVDQRKQMNDEYLRQHNALIDQIRAPDTDDSSKWMAAAAGFLSPTKAGSFGESLGAAAGNVAPLMQKDKEDRNKALTQAAVQQFQFTKDQREELQKQEKEAITGLVNLEKQKMLADRLGKKSSASSDKINAIAMPIAQGLALSKGLTEGTPEYESAVNSLLGLVRPKIAIMSQMNPDVRTQVESNINWEQPIPEFNKTLSEYQSAALKNARTAQERQALAEQKVADAERANRMSAASFLGNPDEAYEQGIPLFAKNPYASFPTLEGREKYYANQMKVRENGMKEIDKATSNARTELGELEQFKTALAANNGDTGTWIGEQLPFGVGDSVMNMRTFFNPQAKQMQMIYEKLAQKEHTPGSGAMSDKDRDAYRAMAVSPKLTAESADIAVKRKEAALNREMEYARFMAKTFDVNKHWNKGKAEELWNAYTKANPLYSPDKSQQNGWRFNQVPTFEEWFRKDPDKYFPGRGKGPVPNFWSD